MGKKGKKIVKRNAKPQPRPEDEAVVPSEEVKTPEEWIRKSKVQCANCLGMVAPDEIFKCHHCGKTGCSKCGWYPPKNNVCPNCGTTVRVLRGTR